MSELKAYRPRELVMQGRHNESIYLKSEADKVIARHKYKRCLAMAMWCDKAYHRECGLNPEEMTDKEFYKQQIEFWPRWSSRWLAIAKRFKTNSTAQHGKEEVK